MASIPALSAIPYRTSYDEMAAINDVTKELNLSLFVRMQAIVDAHRFDLANYVPYQNIKEEDAWDKIASRIFKHNLQAYMDAEENKDTGLVKSTSKVEKTLSAKVDSDNHHFRFRVRPASTTAVLSYSGIMQASVSYDITDAELKFEVAKNVGRSTVSYTHTDDSLEVKDVVGVRWSF